jgi:hypothetical protein
MTTSQIYGVAGECSALVRDMIKQPRALPFLTSLTLPYRTHLVAEEIGQLLRLYGPMEDYPGLAVSATLIFDRRDKGVYNGRLEREDGIAGAAASILPTTSSSRSGANTNA